MSPDEIKNVRRVTGMSQKDVAEALSLEVSVVREWEKGERFPTKAHCDQMQAWLEKPPPRPKKRGAGPMEQLADPAFFLLLRKLLAHPPLRAAVERLATEYADPLDSDTSPKRT